jgi:shikimate kinase
MPAKRLPLCLIGMSGIGKSFWARRLEAAGFARHDCDGAIVAKLGSLVEVLEGEDPVNALGRWMGMPWAPGYDERERRYLALEEEVTRGALTAASGEGGDHVIDTTGSVIYLSPALLQALATGTRIVYLRSPESQRAAMLRRYLDEPKPVVWGGVFSARPGETHEQTLWRSYGELLGTRDRRYATLAHLTVDGAELEASDPGLAAFVARCYGVTSG